jgi:hypothetical protein
MKQTKRLPYLAIHMIFSSLSGPETIQMSTPLQQLAEKELNEPSPESLLVHTLFSQVPEWSVEQQLQTLEKYRSRRGAKSGIRFPRLFEAAIALDLSERYRVAGDEAACHTRISEAADDFPESAALRAFAKSVDVSVPVQWRKVLLSKTDAQTQ